MLTDEQIATIGAEHAPYTDFRFARAIESAATAPLLERIAELERECDRLEDYWNRCLADCKNIAELERQLEESRNQALE